MDTNFPHIVYDAHKSPRDWGRAHGEQYRTGIAELAQIRRELMAKKNPKLKGSVLDELAKAQWTISLQDAPVIMDELEGIRLGSNLSLTDIVILNNYTDFRDIDLAEEGCTTAAVKTKNAIIAGQTWDMHASAKNFLCLIEVPAYGDFPKSYVLSLLGCVGLMGLTSHRCLVGVNNINTVKARAGIIWPVLVRQSLKGTSAEEILQILMSANVTSGHNYLVCDGKTGGLHAEIAPSAREVVGDNRKNSEGIVFHTNHCLGATVSQFEKKSDMSSTTHARFDQFEKLKNNIVSAEALTRVLKNHDGFPKSICSHYQTGENDPSTTCGGGVADLTQGKVHFWRGCQERDANYVERNFNL